MSDIVERLRQTRADMIGTTDEAHYWDCVEAANEIEKLRAALKPCVDYFSWNGGLIRDEEYEAAAAALKETGYE